MTTPPTKYHFHTIIYTDLTPFDLYGLHLSETASPTYSNLIFPGRDFFISNPARNYSTLICIRLQHIHYGINGIVRFKNDVCVREYVFGYEKKYSFRAQSIAAPTHQVWRWFNIRKGVDRKHNTHTDGCCVLIYRW